MLNGILKYITKIKDMGAYPFQRKGVLAPGFNSSKYMTTVFSIV